jgi:uncharacterized protein YndB with AHSA1/START domain
VSTASSTPDPGASSGCGCQAPRSRPARSSSSSRPTRVVFTWGWEGPGSPVPPGSTTVTVELAPDAAGTRLTLTHTGLAPQAVLEHHRAGWERYTERLRIRVEGGDPGTDAPSA